MKKFWITLLSILMLVTGVAFVAACDSCDSKDENVLTSYVLGVSLVDDDFALPLTIGGKEVKWVSDNEDAIAVEKRSEDYLAKVTLGETQANAQLTVSVGKESKSFNVTVSALDVHYFASKYTFKQNNATVYKDFDLDTSYTINGKTATITWSIDRDQDKEYIALNADKNKCLVTQSTIDPSVRLYATFSYNGITQKVPYKLTVSFERGHKEEVDYWYNNTGVSITMSGYVVAIGTAYSESYGNVTLYMIDDDFCAGYYLYRVKASAENGAKLKPGVHITVTGTTNTNYNGLVETNAGGTLVVDDDKTALTEAELASKVYALDNDLVSGAPAAIYNTSRLVSLDKWTVKSVPEKAPEAGANGTLFTIEKGGVEVKIRVSKYLEGVYACKEGDATWTALIGLHGSINKDDVISVKGILGNGNGYEIIPLSADDVTKAEAGTAATAVPAYAEKVSKAIEDVAKAIPSYIISSTTNLTVPVSNDTVEIKYELLRPSKWVSLADIASGKIAVTAGIEDIAGVLVTYTVKNGEEVAYTTSTYHFIHSMEMSAEEIAESVRFNISLNNKETAADDIKLNEDKGITSVLAQYPTASISWSLKAGQTVTGVDVVNNVLKVTPSTTADREVVVVATVSCGDKTATKEFTITIKKVTPVEVGNYNFVLDLTNAEDVKEKLYFTGAIDGNYAGTTNDATKAGVVVIAEVNGGYTMTVGGKYFELVRSGNYANPKLLDASTGVWQYDYSLNTFTWTSSDNKVWYLGTYTNTTKNETRKTIGASETKYISGDNASKVGVTQFVVGFEKTSGSTTPTEPTPPPTEPTTPAPEGSVIKTLSIADHATANSWVNGTQYSTINIDDIITATTTGESGGVDADGNPYSTNSGKYYTKGNNWRHYQTEKVNLTFTAATGYKIYSIKITYSGANNGILLSSDKSTQYESGTVISVDAATVSFTVGQTTATDKANGNVQISAIEVVYVAA